MKHAFLIMAYQDYWMLNQIVQSIDDERNDIYIHMDAKAKDFTEDLIAPTKFSKVYFTERIEVSWAGDSKIKCIILMLYNAYRNGNYRYYHLMTESDYVIKNQEYFHDFFKKHDGMEFISFRKSKKAQKYMERYYDIYHYFQNELGRYTQYSELFPVEQNFLIIQKQNNTHRMNNEMTYYKSEGVYSLTAEFVDYVLRNIGFIANYFFIGSTNDEHYLATLIMNSEFKDKIYPGNIRLFVWDRSKSKAHPTTFTCSRYDEIANSDCLFARKFNSFIDYKVVYAINQRILGKPNNIKLDAYTSAIDINDAIRNSDYSICISQYVAGSELYDCPIVTEKKKYHLIIRGKKPKSDEEIINDECTAVIWNNNHQCSAIKVKNTYYSMGPRYGYHLFFVKKGKVDGCIIDASEGMICNPLIKTFDYKDDLPVFIDEDMEMLESDNCWQRYKAVKMLLSRTCSNINFNKAIAKFKTEESPYSYAALASLYGDNRYPYYNPGVACDYLRKAINSKEIWIIEQWSLELFDLLQSSGKKSAYKESIAVIEPFVQSGNGRAIGRLAGCYRDGKGVDKDLKKAADLMKDAANQDIEWAKRQYFDLLWTIGTTDALREMIDYAQKESDKGNVVLRARLGRAYRDGKGVDKDLKKAADLMKDAANQDIEWAKKDYAEIMVLIDVQESLRRKQSKSQVKIEDDMELSARLARAYRDGKGVDKDLKKAADLMKEVANQGKDSAKLEYFDILWELKDSETDKEMFNLIESLQNKRSAEYQIRLSRCYRDGRGIKKDLDKASKLMKDAANQNNDQAKIEYYDILWDINTPESHYLMVEFGQKESDSGNLELRARLARAYRDGKGVDKDLKKAAELMRTVLSDKPMWARWEYIDILYTIDTPAANEEAFAYLNSVIESGNKQYEARLARCYRDGKGTEVDVEKAIYYMRLAANKDLGWAKNQLFDLLWNCNNKEYDREAYLVIKPFAESGNGNAMRRLAKCYRDGRGVTVDLTMAEEWMSKAVDKKVKGTMDELIQIQEMKKTVNNQS